MIPTLPHAPPAQLIDRVNQHDARHIACSARLRALPYADADARIETSLCIELVAQAAAAHLALRGDGSARPGVLLAVRRAQLHVASLQVDDDLEVHATLTTSADPLAHYSGRVLRGAEEVAALDISVYCTDSANDAVEPS